MMVIIKCYQIACMNDAGINTEFGESCQILIGAGAPPLRTSILLEKHSRPFQ